VASTTRTGQLILDDGEFYVVLNPNHAPDVAAGYLERRCFVTPSTPGGFECIGSFTMQPGGLWEAKISKVYEAADDSDCTVVTHSVDRRDAIVALWKARYEAFVGYHTL